MERTINEITRNVTRAYLESLDPANPPDPGQVEKELVMHVRNEVNLENAVRGKNDQLKKPTTLTFSQIADIMAYLYHICRIRGDAKKGKDLLVIYQSEGENEGIYVGDKDIFRAIARRYNYLLTDKDFREIMTALYDMADRKPLCQDRDIIALGNGLLDYRTKQLMPFDPQYIFLSKARVNWNPQAQNIPIIEPDGRPWDFESWLMEVCNDDEGLRDLILEMIGATLRPHVGWGKAFFLYAKSGANGKGTICQLCRNILGAGSHMSLPISQMGEKHGLAGIDQVQAIITDENDVGAYLSKAGNFKDLVTGDAVTVEPKFQNKFSLRWFGLIIECFNDYPSVKDRTNSFLRRLIIIPFNKTFVGCERPEIKQDYLARQEVLEYVLKRVLEMDYYTFHIPEICEQAMADYKEKNDPVVSFLNEMLPQFTWDLLPFPFLYDLYRAHYAKTNGPQAQICSRQTFIDNLLEAIKDNDEWECKDRRARVASANRMSWPEPLIAEYNLTDWMSKTYHGSDPDKVSVTNPLKPLYSGLVRTTPTAGKMVS